MDQVSGGRPKGIEFLSGREVRQRLRDGEQALRTQLLDKPHAETTKLHAEAASTLIAALATVEEAVVRIGDMLLVKRCGDDGRTRVDCHSLTASQIRQIEEDPTIIQQPDSIRALISAQSP